MQQTAVIPAWVVPPPGQVADCYRLAYAAATQTRGHRVAAITATISWVTGLQDSPMTEHPAEATKDAARTEMEIADGVDPDHRAVTNDPQWAAGVAVTLGWLLGLYYTPPMLLPRRLADGTTPTAEQLYEEYIAGTFGEPEVRRSARGKAAHDAARYRRLAELADSVH